MSSAAALLLLQSIALPVGAFEGVSSGSDPFAGLEPIADERLAEQRGRLNVGGFDLEFGLAIEVNGQLVQHLSTAPQEVAQAIRSSGRTPVVAGLTYEHAGQLTVVENSLDHAVLSQRVVVDVVVTDVSAQLASPGASMMRDLPPPNLFGSL